MTFSSVIVTNLDLGWPGLGPDEANPELVIDADTVLRNPLALESLQAIGWWNSQFAQCFRCLQHGQLAHGDAFKNLESFDFLTVEKTFGICAPEGLNGHGIPLANKMLTLCDTTVKRYIPVAEAY